MAAMTALVGVAVTALAGFEGLVLAILFAIGMILFAWYNSDKVILKMYGAKELPPSHSLHILVADLARNA